MGFLSHLPTNQGFIQRGTFAKTLLVKSQLANEYMFSLAVLKDGEVMGCMLRINTSLSSEM